MWFMYVTQPAMLCVSTDINNSLFLLVIYSCQVNKYINDGDNYYNLGKLFIENNLSIFRKIKVEI